MTATEMLRKRVKKYIDKADEKSLKMVQAILEVEEEYGWWGDLSDEAKESIKKGLNDAEEGRVTSHKEVMKKYKKWL